MLLLNAKPALVRNERPPKALRPANPGVAVVARRCDLLRHGCLVMLAVLVALPGSRVCGQAAPGPPIASAQAATNSPSVLLEAAGQVEVAFEGAAVWQAARPGTTLKPGDRIRTQAQSRAAVQLSDRSVIRLSERTTLEILAPRRAEKKRFGLRSGALFFFNREKPADVEFDTPLAAGAIRGTEFLLEVGGPPETLRLALIDGLVSLRTLTGDAVALERGEDLVLSPGQPPQKTALLNAVNAIQWALYYPAVLDPDELNFSDAVRNALAPALAHYRSGELLAALTALPPAGAEESAGATFRAAVELAVGRAAEAAARLNQLPTNAPGAAALRELMAVVRGGAFPLRDPQTASDWLARSYSLQATAQLPAALAAAERAAALAPGFGAAAARVAELEFSFGHRRAALAALERALQLAPRLPAAFALRGYVLLEQGDTQAALASFERARGLDAALGPAWLGRGLCLLRDRRFAEARASFQAAAALEPQRALFRSYLGKAASEMGDTAAAQKEFGLARRLDPKDPTGWLYSALHLWQQNDLNQAIRDLERSIELNDERAPFRSRLLLDRDRAVRSADLAALYADAGLSDVSGPVAVRSVVEDYANFSGHLFLANSLQAREDVNRYDLRLETARQSELLLANLLAPPGAGNLSQQLSEQAHLQFFEPRPVAGSVLAEYESSGSWRRAGSVFGSLDGFSYAFDARHEETEGQRANEDAQRHQLALTLKQRVAAQDEFYFQAGYYHAQAGDLAALYDPADANTGLRVRETQDPTLYAGWHHEWSPATHTLLLLARLDDRLQLDDPQDTVLFLQQSGGATVAVAPVPFLSLDFNSHVTLYSAELQQLWETPGQTVVVGGRWQHGTVDSHALLSRTASGVVTDQDVHNRLDRGNVYAYSTWRIGDHLRLIGGLSYDHLQFPENSDFAPVSDREETRGSWGPKAGLLWTPWSGGLWRAGYSRSLGGVFFDNSVRLEPTQVGGVNQAFRSLIPESVEGLVPGTRFDTAAAGFDQSFARGSWFGAETEWLHSDGDRVIGTLTNAGFLPFPDTASGTRQDLKFRERDLTAYVAQLLGDWFSLGARYRLSEGRLDTRLPQIPVGTPGLSVQENANRSLLHQVSLAANFHHTSGLFAQWESTWYHQGNFGYGGGRPGDDFWQHNLMAGYRFPRRLAEVRIGVLNLFDTDYKLNPLNLHAALPRERTFVASLRLNF